MTTVTDQQCDKCLRRVEAWHRWGAMWLCDNCAAKRTPVEDEPEWVDLDFGDDEWERALAAENQAALAADNERRTA